MSAENLKKKRNLVISCMAKGVIKNRVGSCKFLFQLTMVTFEKEKG